MDVDLPFKLSLVADLSGHDDRAWHVAWNLAKPLIASCSADKTVRMYSYRIDTSTHKIKFENVYTIPTGHAKTVRSLAWSPSGQTLATASFDSNIGIWEQEPGEEGEHREWECAVTLEGHETECKSVAYSASGTYLASCSRDKTVWIWEVEPDSEFECVAVLMEHTQDVKCVAWHPVEEILASASYDDTIKLYVDDPSDDWFTFATLRGHESTVWSVAWSPRGSYLASSSDDRTIRVWKRVAQHKWTCVLSLGGHTRPIYSLSWAAAGSTGDDSLGWLASCGGDGIVNVWEFTETDESANPEMTTPPEYRQIARLTSAHGVHDVNTVAWCPREEFNTLLATTGDDGHARIWKVESC